MDQDITSETSHKIVQKGIGSEDICKKVDPEDFGQDQISQKAVPKAVESEYISKEVGSKEISSKTILQQKVPKELRPDVIAERVVPSKIRSWNISKIFPKDIKSEGLSQRVVHNDKNNEHKLGSNSRKCDTSGFYIPAVDEKHNAGENSSTSCSADSDKTSCTDMPKQPSVKVTMKDCSQKDNTSSFTEHQSVKGRKSDSDRNIFSLFGSDGVKSEIERKICLSVTDVKPPSPTCPFKNAVIKSLKVIENVTDKANKNIYSSSPHTDDKNKVHPSSPVSSDINLDKNILKTSGNKQIKDKNAVEILEDTSSLPSKGLDAHPSCNQSLTIDSEKVIVARIGSDMKAGKPDDIILKIKESSMNTVTSKQVEVSKSSLNSDLDLSKKKSVRHISEKNEMSIEATDNNEIKNSTISETDVKEVLVQASVSENELKPMSNETDIGNATVENKDSSQLSLKTEEELKSVSIEESIDKEGDANKEGSVLFANTDMELRSLSSDMDIANAGNATKDGSQLPLETEGECMFKETDMDSVVHGNTEHVTLSVKREVKTLQSIDGKHGKADLDNTCNENIDSASSVVMEEKLKYMSDEVGKGNEVVAEKDDLYLSHKIVENLTNVSCKKDKNSPGDGVNKSSSHILFEKKEDLKSISGKADRESAVIAIKNDSSSDKMEEQLDGVSGEVDKKSSGDENKDVSVLSSGTEGKMKYRGEADKDIAVYAKKDGSPLLFLEKQKKSKVISCEKDVDFASESKKDDLPLDFETKARSKDVSSEILIDGTDVKTKEKSLLFYKAGEEDLQTMHGKADIDNVVLSKDCSLLPCKSEEVLKSVSSEVDIVHVEDADSNRTQLLEDVNPNETFENNFDIPPVLMEITQENESSVSASFGMEKNEYGSPPPLCEIPREEEEYNKIAMTNLHNANNLPSGARQNQGETEVFETETFRHNISTSEIDSSNEKNRKLCTDLHEGCVHLSEKSIGGNAGKDIDTVKDENGIHTANKDFHENDVSSEVILNASQASDICQQQSNAQSNTSLSINDDQGSSCIPNVDLISSDMGSLKADVILCYNNIKSNSSVRLGDDCSYQSEISSQRDTVVLDKSAKEQNYNHDASSQVLHLENRQGKQEGTSDVYQQDNAVCLSSTEKNINKAENFSVLNTDNDLFSVGDKSQVIGKTDQNELCVKTLCPNEQSQNYHSSARQDATSKNKHNDTSSNIGLQELKQLFQFITSASNIRNDKDESDKEEAEEVKTESDCSIERLPICQICDKQFIDKDKFDNHMLSHEGLSDSKLCSLTDDDDSSQVDPITKEPCESENGESKKLPSNCVPFLYLMQKWLSQELDIEEDVDNLYSIDERADLIRGVYQNCSYEQKNRLVSELSAIPTQLLTLSFDPSHSVSGLLPNIDCEMGCCQEEDLRLKTFIDYALYPSLLVEHLEIQRKHQHGQFPLIIDHDHVKNPSELHCENECDIESIIKDDIISEDIFQDDTEPHLIGKNLDETDEVERRHSEKKESNSDDDSENECLADLCKKWKENSVDQNRKRKENGDSGEGEPLGIKLTKKKKMKKDIKETKSEQKKLKKFSSKKKNKNQIKVKIIVKKTKDSSKERTNDQDLKKIEKTEKTAKKRKRSKSIGADSESSKLVNEKSDVKKLKTRGTVISKKMQKTLEKNKNIAEKTAAVEKALTKPLQLEKKLMVDQDICVENAKVSDTDKTHDKVVENTDSIVGNEKIKRKDILRDVPSDKKGKTKDKESIPIDIPSDMKHKIKDKESKATDRNKIESVKPDSQITRNIQNSDFKNCELCGMTFFKSEHYYKHVTRMHTVSTVHKCSNCGIECLGPKSLEAHENTHKFEFRYNQFKHKCYQCNITFPTRALKEKHLQIHKV